MNRLQNLANQAVADAICPNCQTLYGPGVQLERAGLFRPKVTCPHCGHVNTSVTMDIRAGAVTTGSATGRGQALNPQDEFVEKPAESPVRIESRGFDATEIILPPRNLTTRARAGQAFGLVIMGGLLAGVALAIQSGDTTLEWPDLEMLKSTDWATLWPIAIFLLVPPFIAWKIVQLNRAERKRAATETRIYIDPRDFRFRETQDGQEQRRLHWPIGELQSVRRVEHIIRSQKRRHRIHMIEVTRIRSEARTSATDTTFEFGRLLNDAEQRWLVAELRRLIAGAGNTRVIPPKPADPSSPND